MSDLKVKEIVLFRHAEKASWTANPPLSARGHRQAQSIVEYVQSKKLPPPQLILSSPRLRAEQTLAPLREALGIPMEQSLLLDERHGQERASDFESRVRKLITEELPKSKPTCIYLVTHLDWIEVFSWMLPCTTSFDESVFSIAPAHYFHLTMPALLNEPWILKSQGDIH